MIARVTLVIAFAVAYGVLCNHLQAAPARPQSVSVTDFGAKGDGVSDDTAAIQRALDAAQRVLFPQGTYLVRINSLVLRDGNCLVGEGKLSKIRTTDAGDGQFALFKAFGKTNLTVADLSFETPKSTQMALLFASCTNVTVTRCRAQNCGLVYVGSSAVATMHDINSANAFFDIYDRVTAPEHYSNKVLIEGNECVGDGVKGRGGISLSGIFVSFANNVRIANNDVTKYLHGIMWWGGNANTKPPAANGDIANERKCKNLTITGNTVHGIEMGGIWGAMGEGVAVSGNAVSDCGDVGIDFEGCFTATAMGNAVADCTSACLCTVFDNRGIVFSGNTCAQHTDGWWIASVRNTHHSPGNQDVSFTGNSFTAYRGMSAVVSEGVRQLLFQGNILRNVQVSFHDPTLNHLVQTVIGNQLVFDRAAPGAISGLRVGPVGAGGHVIVQGNSVLTTVAQPKGSKGIEGVAAEGNVVEGWE